MQKDEGLNAKIWLQERENLLKDSPDEIYVHTHKFTLKKSQGVSMDAHIKKNKISWDALVNTAWALTLARLASSDSAVHGFASVYIKTKHHLLTTKVNHVFARIDETLTAKKLLNEISSMLTGKSGRKNITENPAIEYLCLLEAETKPKNANQINIDKFTLSLIYNKKEHNKFTIAFHPGYFKKNNIQKISTYFMNILSGLCFNLGTKVVDIEMMPQDEIKKIMTEWSKPQYQFKTEKLHKCAHELISEFAENHPNHTAIVHNSVSVSFAEMDAKAAQLAMYLAEKGIKPQDKIAVLMERTPALIIAMLAIFKIGAIFLPINPKYPNERIEFVIEDSNASFILVNNISRLQDTIKNKIIVLSQDWSALPGLPPSRIYSDYSHQNVAYIIYTSGTTGRPKGVMINHGSLANLTAWYRSCFNVTMNDRASQFASQGFDTYMCETMPILASGASIHIVDDQIKLTPNAFFDWLRQHRITILDLPTAYAQVLFTMAWPDDLCIRMMKIGGETCTRYPAKPYPFDIWNIYGPTETTIEATYFKMHQANQDPASHPKNTQPSIGKILDNGEIYIVDKYMHPVAPGVAGELLIGGACVSPGYLNREDLTKEKFIENPFTTNSHSKLYRTGDLVTWMPDGNLLFIGRSDNQVKIRGYRIELGAIENVISQYPDVREVAVIAKESQNGEKSIIAYVSPNLDKERFLFQERCLLSIDDSCFYETITEDISRYGIALSGLTSSIPIGKKVKLHIKLPGSNTSKDITARMIWQIDNRCGLVFDLSKQEQDIITKSIDFFISSHNIMDLVLSASAKRSIRRALKNKLPEYMVPTSFVTLLEFPLTFSGKVDVKALPPPDEYEQILKKQFIAPQSETEKSISAIWSAILGRDNISMEDNFFDIGGNSIKAAELSVKVMADFNISIPANILFDLPYIPILAQFIDSNGSKYNSQTSIQDDIDRDKILPENIEPSGKLTTKISNPENVLLTGAGGFLGIFLLNELLTTTNAKIHCLVRKGEFESAARRLDATIRKFKLADRISLSNRRIIAIPSDIGLDKFGLPMDQYKNMAEKVDIIYHCGAQVNTMASYNNLRGSNVLGTHEVIKFAAYLQDKPIHYISTLSSAYLTDESGAFIEEFPNDNCGQLFGGYAISKWVSERLLTELKDRGIPVTIYRSGYISGDSETGITSLNDSLLMLIKGCVTLGYAPDMREKITILPVNFVSKALVKQTLASADKSAVYHIDHPTGIMWSDLVMWLNEYGYDIKILPMSEWKKKLHTIKQDNPLYPFLPYYLALPDDYNPPDVRIEKAAAALKRVGLSYPQINDELLNIYFDYLCSEEFLTRPPSKKNKPGTKKIT